MTKVVITGVSGSLGRFLAEDFLARGYEVVGVSRTDPEIAGIEHISHDLTEEFAGELGADWAVINCAAITRDGNSRALEQANVAITQNALRLTRGPFVQVSTSSVYDLRGPSIRVVESAATGEYGFLNSYSRSKFVTHRSGRPSRLKSQRSIPMLPLGTPWSSSAVPLTSPLSIRWPRPSLT
jgi:nucleoside-diphosphate-sugar epimerase